MTHIVLSLGSNIDREDKIRFAIDQITALFGELEISPVYEAASMGFDGPAFYNLVVGLNSDQYCFPGSKQYGSTFCSSLNDYPHIPSATNSTKFVDFDTTPCN